MAISLPTTAPHTVSFPKVLTKLRWQQENTDYLVLTEVLEQARVVPLDRRWPAEVPAQVLLQAAAVIAHASKQWQVRDLGAYNLAILEDFEAGYKLGVLDMADWVPWGHRYPVFPQKKKGGGLHTMARHAHPDVLKLFESFGGMEPEEVIRALVPKLGSQAFACSQGAGSSLTALSWRPRRLLREDKAGAATVVALGF